MGITHLVLRLKFIYQPLVTENCLLDKQDHLDYRCVVVIQSAKLVLRLNQKGAPRLRYQQTVHPTKEIESTELSSTTRRHRVEFERRILRNIKNLFLKVFVQPHDRLTTQARW